MRGIWGPLLCLDVCWFQFFHLCFLWLCPFVVNTLKLKGVMLLCCEQMLHTWRFSLIGYVCYIPIWYPTTFTAYWKQPCFCSVTRLSAVKTQVVMLFVCVCVWMHLQAFPKQLGARVNFALFFFVVGCLCVTESPFHFSVMAACLDLFEKSKALFLFSVPLPLNVHAWRKLSSHYELRPLQSLVHSAARVILHCHTYWSVLFSVTGNHTLFVAWKNARIWLRGMFLSAAVMQSHLRHKVSLHKLYLSLHRCCNTQSAVCTSIFNVWGPPDLCKICSLSHL